MRGKPLNSRLASIEEAEARSVRGDVKRRIRRMSPLRVVAVLRANPNPPQAATNKGKVAPSFGTRNRNSN